MSRIRDMPKRARTSASQTSMFMMEEGKVWGEGEGEGRRRRALAGAECSVVTDVFHQSPLLLSTSANGSCATHICCVFVRLSHTCVFHAASAGALITVH